MRCMARKCKKSNHEQCTKDRSYGVLCERHARQVALTPTGFQRRRIVRLHLSHLSEKEVKDAEQLYRDEKGEGVIRTSNPMSYRVDVLSYLADGEKTAHQIVEHISSVSPYSMSPSKIGQLMRGMMNEGTVVRRQANISGSWGAIYALKTPEHESYQ